MGEITSYFIELMNSRRKKPESTAEITPEEIERRKEAVRKRILEMAVEEFGGKKEDWVLIKAEW